LQINKHFSCQVFKRFEYGSRLLENMIFIRKETVHYSFFRRAFIIYLSPTTNNISNIRCLDHFVYHLIVQNAYLFVNPLCLIKIWCLIAYEILKDYSTFLFKSILWQQNFYYRTSFVYELSSIINTTHLH